MSPESTVRYVKIGTTMEPLNTGAFIILKTIEYPFGTKFPSSEGVSQPRATQQWARRHFCVFVSTPGPIKQ